MIGEQFRVVGDVKFQSGLQAVRGEIIIFERMPNTILLGLDPPGQTRGELSPHIDFRRNGFIVPVRGKIRSIAGVIVDIAFVFLAQRDVDTAIAVMTPRPN
jgi:hypothetical protein